MTLLAVVGWLAVSVLLAPRIGRALRLPDPQEPTHADPGSAPEPGSAFDEVRFVFPTWRPYERSADWRPLLEMFKEDA